MDQAKYCLATKTFLFIFFIILSIVIYVVWICNAWLFSNYALLMLYCAFYISLFSLFLVVLISLMACNVYFASISDWLQQPRNYRNSWLRAWISRGVRKEVVGCEEHLPHLQIHRIVNRQKRFVKYKELVGWWMNNYKSGTFYSLAKYLFSNKRRPV